MQYGDVWTWIALDAKSKLVPTFAVGDRSAQMANLFMDDLAARLSHRVQISSDALAAYSGAIERAFGEEVDYGSIVKTFSQSDVTAARRYSPPEVVSVKPRVHLMGNPVEKLISTSYVEKQNHTLRMHCRRLSRLTNAFSKKLENFKAAIGLHYAYYNFVKTHTTIRCTPAVAAGGHNFRVDGGRFSGDGGGMSDRIAKLQDAIEAMHRCKAVHVSSEVVIELFRGEVAWDGVVETFDLTGHPWAKRCYAWSYEDKGETQYVTVLELPPVDSPETAVKVAIGAAGSRINQ